MRLTPRRSRLGVGGLVVSGLAVAQALSSLMPPVNDVTVYGAGLQRPFERALTAETAAELRTGTVRLREVATSTRVQTPQMLVTAEPGATFLTVTVDFTARDRQGQIAGAWLDDPTGRRYLVELGHSDRDGVFCSEVAPGLTARCAAVFELPLDALTPDTRVTLAAHSAEEPYDDAAVLILGERAEPLAAGSRSTTPVTLHLGVLGKDV